MSCTGMLSIHPLEATAERTLPGEASIPADLRAERTQLAIDVREAGATGPVKEMKRLSGPFSDLLDLEAFRRAQTQVTGHNHKSV